MYVDEKFIRSGCTTANPHIPNIRMFKMISIFWHLSSWMHTERTHSEWVCEWMDSTEFCSSNDSFPDSPLFSTTQTQCLDWGRFTEGQAWRLSENVSQSSSLMQKLLSCLALCCQSRKAERRLISLFVIAVIIEWTQKDWFEICRSHQRGKHLGYRFGEESTWIWFNRACHSTYNQLHRIFKHFSAHTLSAEMHCCILGTI